MLEKMVWLVKLGYGLLIVKEYYISKISVFTKHWQTLHDMVSCEVSHFTRLEQGSQNTNKKYLYGLSSGHLIFSNIHC